MTTQVAAGQVITPRETALVATEAANMVANAIRAATARSGRAAIALSGGNTPRDAYALLAKEPKIDWTKVHVFWVDERAVAPTDDRSNFRWAKATLLDHIAVPAENVHRMAADSADLEAAARDYERTIREYVTADGSGVASFDMLVMGVGDDGHTASLFPGEPTVDITDAWVAIAAAGAGREARMTLTPPLIEHARSIVVLAVGAAKHAPLERAWSVKGDVHQTPARVVRACRGEVIWIIDRAAAGLD